MLVGYFRGQPSCREYRNFRGRLRPTTSPRTRTTLPPVCFPCQHSAASISRPFPLPLPLARFLVAAILLRSRRRGRCFKWEPSDLSGRGSRLSRRRRQQRRETSPPCRWTRRPPRRAGTTVASARSLEIVIPLPIPIWICSLAAAGNGSGKIPYGAGNTDMRFVALESNI